MKKSNINKTKKEINARKIIKLKPNKKRKSQKNLKIKI